MPRVDFIGQRSTHQNFSVNTSWLWGGKKPKPAQAGLFHKKTKAFSVRAALLEGSYVAAWGRTTTPPVQRLGRRGDSVAIVPGHTPATNTDFYSHFHSIVCHTSSSYILQGGKREMSLTQASRPLYSTFFNEEKENHAPSRQLLQLLQLLECLWKQNNKPHRSEW